MLYLDYGKQDGNWLPNEDGGNENYDAIKMLMKLNKTIEELEPGVFVIAEESTSWAGVTAPVSMDGLGFMFKWNMGWMNDFLEYMGQIKNMGGISSIMSMMPGLSGQMKNVSIDDDEAEKNMRRTESIIYSMTKAERSNPDILNPSRKNRIARGAGVDIADVNRLVKQFEQMKKMMKQMPGMMKGAKKGRFKLPF